MALDGTYAGLQASIAAWINRTDLTAVIPDFITLAEAKIGRDLRLRKQVVSTTLSTVASTRGVTLPTDWLEFETVTLAGSPDRRLNFVSQEQLDYTYPNADQTGQPSLYSMEGDQIVFGPTPGGVYSIDIAYFQKFTALSLGANWLFTNHPNIYLNLALSYACHYIKDAKRTAEYLDLYERDKTALQEQDEAALHSGSTLRVRTT